ncbi:sterol regulatory element-binding protein cleavage-activating protein-like [Oppia nitens]|uniref:sterol regulatory element-binding protein cleavage-activating protein-like n=1 Tax=Oppia nitens TaxID=1686743 RepID=UPI0023DCE044|nr:sterol regulatory element-binding protein cleavage-activating protein-like [Oppia nitens]
MNIRRTSSSSALLSTTTTDTTRWTNSSSQLLQTIEDSISNVYYKYGLICSRHPVIVIVTTLLIVGICCYPLTGIRYLLGNSSQKFMTTTDHAYDSPPNINNKDRSADHPIPDWYESNQSLAFIQQIVVKSAVIPWKDNLILMDAIRAPLLQSFKLIESISNYQSVNGESAQSLDNYCFQISEPIAKMVDKQSATFLPTFSCLVLSPSNIWQNDINKFLMDPTIIKTMYSVKDLTSHSSGSGSLRDILFGIPWMETGIKRLYVRTRQRTITYAITLVLSKHSQQYIDGLTNFLKDKYSFNPLLNNDTNEQNLPTQTLTHIYFQNKFTFYDFMPLLATYVMLFLYMYFSVRKIDIIKNKWALALCSLLTVIMSLMMSLGICLRLGFNPTLNGTHILPYVVIIIGLENMLVLTKSVVSAPAHLDIKVRMAQGLSREGWSITKNLMTEITLLTFGFFTFVPIIQKLCLFATVGLLTDFFIQITFFATVLSIDIQRLELNNKGHSNGHISSQSHRTHSRHNSAADMNGVMYGNRTYGQNVFARPSKPNQFKMPKRLRVVYFVARTRLVQRALMVVLIGWISFLVYNFGILDHLGNELQNANRNSLFRSFVSENNKVFIKNKQNSEKSAKSDDENDKVMLNKNNSFENILEMNRLVHHNPDFGAERLSSQHWSALFNYYNLSVSGNYITILPPILLSVPTPPESAIQMRHPAESDPQIFRQFLSPSGLHLPDPDDNFSGLNSDTIPHIPMQWSKMEIMITLGLSIPSIIFIIYVFVLMYRCMCSRNYAEWRDSWSQTLRFSKNNNNKKRNFGYDIIDFETNPIKLQDHDQELNLLASNSDTPFVMSICISGDIKVWDVLSGECHTYIKRFTADLNDHNQVVRKRFKPTHKPSGSFSSDSTYGSSPGNSNDFLNEIPNNSLNQICETPSPVRNRSANFDGYNFSSFVSQQTNYSSQSLLTELILNAAVNSEEISSNESTVNLGVESSLPYEPIWCSEIFGKLIIIGCSNGRIEVWDALNGNLCFCYEENKSGVTALKATNTKLVVARLNGTLDIFNVDTINGFSVNITSDSNTSPSPHSAKGQVVRYNLLHSFRAHLQPITCLQILDSSTIITGGLDHQLKVYRLENANCLFTLHGHCGGITTIHIDRYCPFSAISGCQVGQLCVWDVQTRTCVFSLEAHMEASVTAALATPLYFISSGTDNNICIWDKYSGHLVHTIQNHHSFCREMLLLTPNILVTARDDHLVLYDVSEAVAIRMIELDANCDKQSYIKNLKMSSQSRAVVCDYGKQLCVIHFPSATEKSD